MAKTNGGRDWGTKWIRWVARIWSLPLMVYALLLLVGYAWNWVTRKQKLWESITGSY